MSDWEDEASASVEEDWEEEADAEEEKKALKKEEKKTEKKDDKKGKGAEADKKAVQDVTDVAKLEPLAKEFQPKDGRAVTSSFLFESRYDETNELLAVPTPEVVKQVLDEGKTEVSYSDEDGNEVAKDVAWDQALVLALQPRSTQWWNVATDFGGQYCLVDGEALLSHLFMDPTLGWEQGGSTLAATFVIESFLHQLSLRGLQFDVVFLKDARALWAESRPVAWQLAREAVMRHLAFGAFAERTHVLAGFAWDTRSQVWTFINTHMPACVFTSFFALGAESKDKKKAPARCVPLCMGMFAVLRIGVPLVLFDQMDLTGGKLRAHIATEAHFAGKLNVVLTHYEQTMRKLEAEGKGRLAEAAAAVPDVLGDADPVRSSGFVPSLKAAWSLVDKSSAAYKAFPVGRVTAIEGAIDKIQAAVDKNVGSKSLPGTATVGHYFFTAGSTPGDLDVPRDVLMSMVAVGVLARLDHDEVDAPSAVFALEWRGLATILLSQAVGTLGDDAATFKQACLLYAALRDVLTVDKRSLVRVPASEAAAVLAAAKIAKDKYDEYVNKVQVHLVASLDSLAPSSRDGFESCDVFDEQLLMLAMVLVSKSGAKDVLKGFTPALQKQIEARLAQITGTELGGQFKGVAVAAGKNDKPAKAADAKPAVGTDEPEILSSLKCEPIEKLIPQEQAAMKAFESSSTSEDVEADAENARHFHTGTPFSLGDPFEYDRSSKAERAAEIEARSLKLTVLIEKLIDRGENTRRGIKFLRKKLDELRNQLRREKGERLPGRPYPRENIIQLWIKLARSDITKNENTLADWEQRVIQSYVERGVVEPDTIPVTQRPVSREPRRWNTAGRADSGPGKGKGKGKGKGAKGGAKGGGGGGGKGGRGKNKGGKQTQSSGPISGREDIVANANLEREWKEREKAINLSRYVDKRLADLSVHLNDRNPETDEQYAKRGEHIRKCALEMFEEIRYRMEQLGRSDDQPAPQILLILRDYVYRRLDEVDVVAMMRAGRREERKEAKATLEKMRVLLRENNKYEPIRTLAAALSLDSLSEDEAANVMSDDAKNQLAEFMLEVMGPDVLRPRGEKDPRCNPFRPDAWQVNLMDAVDDCRSVLVCAPTSSGKTFVSYYAMERVLRDSDNGMLVYVAPNKALVHQVYLEVKARFSKKYSDSQVHGASKNQIVGIFTRDFRENEKSCQILVTVPACLEFLIYGHDGYTDFARRLQYCICDEVHSIGAEDGATWERIIAAVPAPVIALSATLGNEESFYRWFNRLDAEKRKVLDKGTSEAWLVKHTERWNDLKYFAYDHHDDVAGTRLQSVPAYFGMARTFAISQSAKVPPQFKLLPEDAVQFAKTLREVITERGEDLGTDVKPLLELVPTPAEFFWKEAEVQAKKMAEAAKERAAAAAAAGANEDDNKKDDKKDKKSKKDKKDKKSKKDKDKSGGGDDAGNAADEADNSAFDVSFAFASGMVGLTKAQCGEYSAALRNTIEVFGVEHPDMLQEAFGRLTQGVNEALEWDSVTGGYKGVQDNLRNPLLLIQELEQRDMLPALVFEFSRNRCEAMATALAEATLYPHEEKLEKNKDEIAKLKKDINDVNTALKAARELNQNVDANVEKVEDLSLKLEQKKRTLLNLESPVCVIGGLNKYTSDEDLREFFPPKKFGRFRSQLFVKLLRYGIGVHHAGLGRKYRQAVERMIRLKKLQVVFCTTTLAQGINVPCRTVVIGKDASYLNPIVFHQIAGRAGRRNKDNRGNVVMFGVPPAKIRLLLDSDLPQLNGNIPLNASAVLRMVQRTTMYKYEAEEVLATAAKRGRLLLDKNPEQTQSIDDGIITAAFSRVLHVPLLGNRHPTLEKQLPFYFRMCVDLLRTLGLLDLMGVPRPGCGIVSYLFYLEPANFMAFHLFRDRFFDRLNHELGWEIVDEETMDRAVETRAEVKLNLLPDANEAILKQVMKTLCFLIEPTPVSPALREVQARSSGKGHVIGQVVMPTEDLHPHVRALGNKVADDVMSYAPRYLSTFARAHADQLKNNTSLPVSETKHSPVAAAAANAKDSVTNEDMYASFAQFGNLVETRAESDTRSPFSAIASNTQSGAGSYEDLTDLTLNLRKDMWFDAAMLPVFAFPDTPINAYAYDFYCHGQLDLVKTENNMVRPWESIYPFLQAARCITSSVDALYARNMCSDATQQMFTILHSRLKRRLAAVGAR